MSFFLELEFVLLLFSLSIPIVESMTSKRLLKLSCGNHLAYYSKKGSHSPGVVCLNGFRSDMNGRKAVRLEQHCQRANRSFVRFDYRGHGESSGDFMEKTEKTLSDWIQDSLHILDHITNGPQILVGSSMGAWIALHVALQRPDRVTGIVGVAAAPDFTKDLWSELSTSEANGLETNGVIYRPSVYSTEPYPITLKLIADAKKWFLLEDESSIPITCPVHFLHGQQDNDVSWLQSVALADRLDSSIVAVTLIKNGNHRLSQPSDLQKLVSAIEVIAGEQD